MNFKIITLTVLSFCFILLGFTNSSEPKLKDIPARDIKAYQLLGDTGNMVFHINHFEISSFVTYKEYKVYLEAIRKDSSASFYQSQLPDTAMCQKAAYTKYISGTEYDNYPVIGITWEAAMNYCRWMTLKEKNNGNTYIYRLPKCSEWIDAYDYLKNSSEVNDMNQIYSDWLLNTMDESFFNFGYRHFELDYFWWAKKTDPNVLKRKVVIGNSYLTSLHNFKDYLGYSYYSFHGYRQVGFRYVKCKVEGDTITTNILKYWNINKNTK